MSCVLWAAHKAMEMKLAAAESCKQKEVAELKERIAVLEKELDNANDLLSDTTRRGQQRSSAYIQQVCMSSNSCFMLTAGTISAPVLPDDQLSTMSPTAAAVTKIRPGMKLTEVHHPGAGGFFKIFFYC